MVKRDDFAVDDHVRKFAAFFGDCRKLGRPIEPLARLENRLASLDAQLDAITVELDFMTPTGAAWRPLDRRAEFERNEVRQRRRFHGARRLVRAAGFRRLAAVRSEERRVGKECRSRW